MTTSFLQCNLHYLWNFVSIKIHTWSLLYKVTIEMRHFNTIALLFAIVINTRAAIAQDTKSPPNANSAGVTNAPKISPPNKEYVLSTKGIDAAGQKQINAFIADRAGQILSGDTKAVRQATNDIVMLLRQQGATPIFVRACFDSLKPWVAKIIDTNNEYRISNFLQVIRWTRSWEALDILIDQSTPAKQKDGVIRISASRLLPNCITSGNLTAPQVDGAARRIREAAENENNWIVTVHDLQALAALSLASQVAQFEPQVKITRGEFLKVLEISIQKASNANDPQQVFAAQRGMIFLRDMLVSNSTPAEKKAISAPIVSITQKAYKLAEMVATSSPASDTSLIQSGKSIAAMAEVVDTQVGLQKPKPNAKSSS